MLDIKVIRENPELVKEGAQRKCLPERAEAVDRLLTLDRELRELIPRFEQLRSQQKRAAKQLGSLAPAAREQHLIEQKSLKAEIRRIDQRQKELRELCHEELLQIPNLPDPEVPPGKDETANVEVRTWGEIPGSPRFDYRAHYELGELQGWLDFLRASELAGSRNYMLFGDLVALQDAVLRFAVDHMVAKGFVSVDPPLMVRDQVMIGTGFFPGGEEQTYRSEKDGLNLIGTSEVPVTSIHAGEILAEEDLPKRYVSRSCCFRREAGTYGKDTRGLYRVHQFNKVEQVIVDVADRELSVARHLEILQNSEEVLQALELPYRVVLVCAGDLGLPQACKFDIECWMPSRKAYGETHSASRFYDYQARRLNLRYRRKSDAKTAFCHTLNNTVLASPRILIPLLEIHQCEDGRVRIPKALQSYMGGREVIGSARCSR